jgi:hypothetical protein
MDTVNNLKNISPTNKLLTFKCPDLDSPYDSEDMRFCQYCFHIPENEVKLPPEQWVCDLPNREAQRRFHANLDSKQKALL